MSTPDTPAEEPVLRDLGWGVREVLHWLVDRVSAPLPADAPTAAEVHAAIDAVHEPAPPVTQTVTTGPSYGGF